VVHDEQPQKDCGVGKADGLGVGRRVGRPPNQDPLQALQLDWPPLHQLEYVQAKNSEIDEGCQSHTTN